MRQTIFRTHGVPSAGITAGIAQSVRQVQKVDNFVDFLKAMDVKQIPKKSEFVNFLKKTVTESMGKGYSKWALTQERALWLRLTKEPGVERVEGMAPMSFMGAIPSFFRGQAHGRQNGGQRGGRGMERIALRCLSFQYLKTVYQIRSGIDIVIFWEVYEMKPPGNYQYRS